MCVWVRPTVGWVLSGFWARLLQMQYRKGNCWSVSSGYLLNFYAVNDYILVDNI